MSIRKVSSLLWTVPRTTAGDGHGWGGVRRAGFTLIELLIVMSIIAILASIAAPTYQRSVIRARESVLREDLYQMRQSIDAFFADRGRYPETLDELVEKRYLRDIPRDPFTRSAETWYTIAPEVLDPTAPQLGGVYDVRSGSDMVGLNGVPYRDW
jgi:general secretion pathway protein G